MSPIQSISYPVYFRDSLQELSDFIRKSTYSKVFILVDTNTNEHCLPQVQKVLEGLDYDLIEVDPGEANKNIDYCIGIWRMLLDFGADRNSLLVNLGGGVLTDMGGFAASTFKRGIDFVQVPTTLLSQVDASVGGKTGIDMENVKNIIGTFTQPQAVFIHTPFLDTLSEDELRSGYAEVIKHGLIYDEDLYRKVKETSFTGDVDDLVYRSVEIKNEVVIADPFEKGLRKILNYGHTIGHALESYSLKHDKRPLMHGEAIAIGFICEGWLSVQKGGLSAASLDDITAFICSVYEPYDIKSKSFNSLMEIMKNDKKNNAGQISFSLLEKIGKCNYDTYCGEDEILSSLQYYTDYINDNKIKRHH